MLTIEKNCVNIWITYLFTAEKIDVFDPHILCNSANGFFLCFSRDMSHKSKIFDKSTSLGYQLVKLENSCRLNY